MFLRAFQPLFNHILAVLGQDGFRVKLHAAHVVLPVPQGHHLALDVARGHHQIIAERISRYGPTVVTTHPEGVGKSLK